MSEKTLAGYGTRSGVEGTTRLVLAAIILLGVGVRLFRLGAGSIWYDEGVSLYLARLSIPALIAHTAGDIHPPLYYMLLHVWLAVAGHSTFAAAFLSLFCGVLLIPATFLVARRLLGHSVALLAAALVALSPYHLWYSQELRMYTLGALLGLLSCYFLMRALAAGGRREAWPAWLGYVLCAVAGLYSLYYFAFLLLCQNLGALAWLWRSHHRDTEGTENRSSLRSLCLCGGFTRWLAAQAAVLLMFLPWLPTALRQMLNPPVPPWRSFTSLWALLVESWSALSLGQSVQTASVWPVLLLTALLCLAALWPTYRRWASLTLLGYTFGPLLVIFLLSLWTPLFHVRYVFLYAPAFAIVLARGLRVLGQRASLVGVLAVSVILVAGFRSTQSYFYDDAYAADDHRGAVRWIADRLQPGDAVLINAGYAYPTFSYYYTGEIAWQGRLTDYAQRPAPTVSGVVVLQTGSLGADSTLGWGSPASDFYATTDSATAAALDEVARRHQRLWVLRIYDTVTDPQGFIRSYLDEHFLQLDDAGFGGASSMRVQLYRTYRTPVTAAPAMGRTVQANLGNQMRLLGYDPTGELYPGESGALTIYWQALAARPDLRAFVSLVDGSGREWGHWDDPPGGRLYPTSRWAAQEVMAQGWRLPVAAGTPPGQYTLVAGLYEAGSGARLDVYDANGQSLGAQVSLGTVQVGKGRLKVDIKTLPVQQRTAATLGGEVRLVGYSVSSRLAKPGESVEVTVYWQGITAGGDERTVFVQIVDGRGKLWAASEGPPAAAWDAGELLRDQYRLTLPADAPDGELRLRIGIFRNGDKQRLEVRNGLLGRADSVDLGIVRVAGREHVYTAPVMQHTLAARLGEGAALLGYDVAPVQAPLSLAAGDAVQLTLYWQGGAPMPTSYTVFVQLLGAGNRLGGQHDALPGDGLLPTTSWVSGEVLADAHRVAVRADAQPGVYRLVAGLYDAASGTRLPVTVNGVRQDGDMVTLGQVTVR